jgi:hypothetical protein
MKTGNHPVAVERDVVAQTGRKLRIGLNAKKGAVKLGWNFTFDIHISNICLYA